VSGRTRTQTRIWRSAMALDRCASLRDASTTAGLRARRSRDHHHSLGRQPGCSNRVNMARS